MSRRRFLGLSTVTAVLLTFGADQVIRCDSAFGADAGGPAKAAAPRSVVLSQTQVLVRTSCGGSNLATVDLVNDPDQPPEHFTGSLVGLHEPGIPVPNWTLLTLVSGSLRSGQKYALKLPAANGGGAVKCYAGEPITIDTAPKVTYVPNPLPPGGKLQSNVAFSFPGDATPINLVGADCKAQDAKCTDVVVDLHGVQIHTGRIRFEKLNLDQIQKTGEIANPNNIGAFDVSSEDLQASLTATTPNKEKDKDKDRGTVVTLSNVLIGRTGELLKFTQGPLTARKAPATKDLAWLWINGTITAGTGTTPAWVLDGKIDAPSWETRGPLIWKLATATANVGNNKIGGQAAKDVIDFSSPSATWLHAGRGFGATVNISPTYETNLALSHKNFLAVADGVVSWNSLNQTLAVRTAETYFRLRDDQQKHNNDHPDSKDLKEIAIPDQGKFLKGYPVTGWSLTPHIGFETGDALSTTTVKNPSTKATIGVIPTYSIARFVPQIDGLYQFRNFSLESYLTGRYLFTTEHTAVNNKAGIPYLETVSGWKAVNVLTFSYSPGSSSHVKFNVAYTEGFSAPTYQRADGVKIGVAVAY
jgi:hypothetical protein